MPTLDANLATTLMRMWASLTAHFRVRFQTLFHGCQLAPVRYIPTALGLLQNPPSHPKPAPYPLRLHPRLPPLQDPEAYEKLGESVALQHTEAVFLFSLCWAVRVFGQASGMHIWAEASGTSLSILFSHAVAIPTGAGSGGRAA